MILDAYGPRWSQRRKMVRIGHQPCDACEPGAARQSQMEAGHWGNRSAARVTGHRPLAGDSHYRPASTLLDFSWKCLFLSVPRWEVALLLISSLFIKGAPEESEQTIRSEGGWVVERQHGERVRERKNERLEYTQVAAWFSSIFIQEKGRDDMKCIRVVNGPLWLLWLPLHYLHPVSFFGSVLLRLTTVPMKTCQVLLWLLTVLRSWISCNF